jgi:hypothetical protein
MFIVIFLQKVMYLFCLLQNFFVNSDRENNICWLLYKGCSYRIYLEIILSCLSFVVDVWVYGSLNIYFYFVWNYRLIMDCSLIFYWILFFRFVQLYIFYRLKFDYPAFVCRFSISCVAVLVRFAPSNLPASSLYIFYILFITYNGRN